jgi:hypothetical protein
MDRSGDCSGDDAASAVPPGGCGADAGGGESVPILRQSRKDFDIRHHRFRERGGGGGYRPQDGRPRTQRSGSALRVFDAGVYVVQIEDDRLAKAMARGSNLNATGEVLARHGGLWFNDEVFVIRRKRG